MPFYIYKGKNEYGENIKGKVEAKTIESAVQELTSRKLLVISIKPMSEDTFVQLTTALFGVGFNDVVTFTRQLSTMISAGLPLANGLSILVRQSETSMSRLVAEILREIEGGSSFAKSLAHHPTVFTRLYVQLVTAGEAGGVLDEVLERLADNMEKSKSFNSKVKGAMIYPVIVLIAMFLVSLIMMIFVIPQLTEMYKDFGTDLPLATEILIAVSEFTTNFWWLIIGGVFGAVFGFKSWYKTKAGELFIDRMLLKIPIFGILIQKVMLTEFSRTLALLLSAGISILRALEIVTDGVGNVVYRNALADVKSQVEKGITISQAMSKYHEFPPILHQMISVGEETGKLDEILNKLSHYFEQESEQAVKNLTAAIEPLIMIVLGVGVGVMVLAVIMPIYSLVAEF